MPCSVTLGGGCVCAAPANLFSFGRRKRFTILTVLASPEILSRGGDYENLCFSGNFEIMTKALMVAQKSFRVVGW